MIKLRKLRVVLVVARSGGVGAAARQLGLSQPAVTRAVQSLENNMGAVLFQRLSRSLVATRAGEIFVSRIERAQAQFAMAERELSSSGEATRLTNRLTGQAADHEFAAFMIIASEGSVSAAAQASGLSQTALNRSLRALEERLSQPLFHRTLSGMRLTPSGELLLIRTKLAFSEVRQGFEEVQSLSGAKGGSLRIGALPLARPRLVPLAVENVLRLYDSAEIAIAEGSYESLVSALRLGDIDILVGTIRRSPNVEGLVAEELFNDDIAIVAGTRHPLAAQDSISLKDCLRWGWVFPFKNVPLRVFFENALDAAGLERPRRIIESDSMAAVRTLLMGGDRLAILSRHQVYQEIEWGRLKILPIKLKANPRPVGLTLRKGHEPTPLARSFLQELRKVAAMLREEHRAG